MKSSTLLRPAIGLTLFFLIFTGLAFPAAIWAISQSLFPHQANGSLIRNENGKVVGSELLGQLFTKPEYFHSRPSAAGAGYDAANSSGTNLGPTSDKLINGIPDDPSTPNVDETYLGVRQLADEYRKTNGLAPGSKLPTDAVTRSASGLDPHITPENARLQAHRVARHRSLPDSDVLRLIEQHTEHPLLGFIGEPRVNVLKLNIALDTHERTPTAASPSRR